jgi:hypothetical protein
MAKLLPKTLYVKIEPDDESPYFVADESAETLVEMGSTVQIGTYQLVETAYAEAVVQFGKKRRR